MKNGKKPRAAIPIFACAVCVLCLASSRAEQPMLVRRPAPSTGVRDMIGKAFFDDTNTTFTVNAGFTLPGTSPARDKFWVANGTSGGGRWADATELVTALGSALGGTPTASVNGTATAGSALTLIRTDGAPKLADPFTPADGTQDFIGALGVGVTASDRGRIDIFGGSAVLQDGWLVLHPSTFGSPTVTGWTLRPQGSDDSIVFARETNAPVLSFGLNGLTLNSDFVYTETDHQLKLGADDSHQGLLTLFGGTTSGKGGKIRLYNRTPDDINVQYFELIGSDTFLQLKDDVGLVAGFARDQVILGRGLAGSDFTVIIDGDSNNGVITFSNANDEWQFSELIQSTGFRNTGLATLGTIWYSSATGLATGLADVATGNALLSGGVGAAPSYGKIALGTVATQADQTILGNNTGGVAAPLALTATQTRTVLGLATGDSPTFVNVTLSGKTAGSVLFAGTAGLLSQDNSNLFFDDSNNRLSVADGVTIYAPLSVGYTSVLATSTARTTVQQGLRLHGSSSLDIDFGSDPNSPFSAWMQSRAGTTTYPFLINPLGGNVSIGSATATSNFNVGTSAQFQVNSSGFESIGGAAFTYPLNVRVSDASNGSISYVAQVEHNVTGTPANGNGAGFLLAGKKSNNEIEFAGGLQGAFTNVTNGSQTGRLYLLVNNLGTPVQAGYFDSDSSLVVAGTVKVGDKLVGTGACTIAAGAGAGSGPSVSFTGSRLGGTVSLTTGTSTTTSAILFTITYGGTAFANGSHPVFSPGNAVAGVGARLNDVYMSGTTTTAVMSVGSTTALLASTAYLWEVTLNGA